MSEYEAQTAANQEHANHLTAGPPLLGDSFKSLLAGAVGGTMEVCTDHPIDLIKVRLQTADKKSKKSLFSMVSNIVRHEGIGGLYRGASIRIITLMPGTAISFWGLDIGKSLVRRYWPDDKFRRQQVLKAGTDVPLSVHQVCWAGAFSAIPVTAFATPSERIKCLLQIQQQQQKGSRGFTTTLQRTVGLRPTPLSTRWISKSLQGTKHYAHAKFSRIFLLVWML